jgi:hypothetical protein
LKGLPPAGGQGAEVAMQMARCKHGAARFMNYQKLHQSGLPAALKETLRSSAVGVPKFHIKKAASPIDMGASSY